MCRLSLDVFSSFNLMCEFLLSKSQVNISDLIPDFCEKGLALESQLYDIIVKVLIQYIIDKLEPGVYDVVYDHKRCH